MPVVPVQAAYALGVPAKPSPPGPAHPILISFRAVGDLFLERHHRGLRRFPAHDICLRQRRVIFPRALCCILRRVFQICLPSAASSCMMPCIDIAPQCRIRTFFSLVEVGLFGLLLQRKGTRSATMLRFAVTWRGAATLAACGTSSRQASSGDLRRHHQHRWLRPALSSASVFRLRARETRGPAHRGPSRRNRAGFPENTPGNPCTRLLPNRDQRLFESRRGPKARNGQLLMQRQPPSTEQRPETAMLPTRTGRSLRSHAWSTMTAKRPISPPPS